MSDRCTIVAGWSRRRIEVSADDVVLDVGCGAFPNERADVACDRSLDEDRHRTGRSTVVDRPFVIADAEALPFRDGAFDFVIASHIAEHVERPAEFCAELRRTAAGGYVETPSPVADYLLDDEYHIWRIAGRDNEISFRSKGTKGAFARYLTDEFYRCFYAGRGSGSRDTHRLPTGWLGRVLAGLLLFARGALNRSGVMHTRVRFRSQDLRVATPDRPRIVLFGRRLESGFMQTERALLEDLGPTRGIEYAGLGPRALVSTVRATISADVIVSFFAAKHALLPALIARALGRRFVVVVGGYDVAADETAGYGLGRRPTRWLPRLVMLLAHEILPFSQSALTEARALAPELADRMHVVPLAVPTPGAPPTDSDRDSVVTVAYVDRTSFHRKGIDRFLELARRTPDREFRLIGHVEEEMAEHLESLPPNVHLAGRVTDECLIHELQRARVYVQLSHHEGFGMAMAEAMLAGAVPLIADQPALREVAGRWSVVSADRTCDLRALELAWNATVDRRAMHDDLQHRYGRDQRRAGLGSAVRSRPVGEVRPTRPT